LEGTEVSWRHPAKPRCTNRHWAASSHIVLAKLLFSPQAVLFA
jgi:hypothetical protein